MSIAEPAYTEITTFFEPTKVGQRPDTLPLLFWIGFGFAATYYILAEWRTENDDYVKYRDVQWQGRYNTIFSWLPLNWAEFILRLVLTFSFGFVFLLSAVFKNHLGLPNGWSEIDLQVYTLGIIYFLFVLWDLFIIDGGNQRLSNWVVLGDFSGFSFVMLSFVFHTNRVLTFFMVLAFLIFGVIALLKILEPIPGESWGKRAFYR